jgi:signal transduction histidine kinase
MLCIFFAGVLAALAGSGAQGPLALAGAGILLIVGLALGLLNRPAPGAAPPPQRRGTGRETGEYERQRTRIMAEMASTLGATLDYNKVLDAAMDVGALGLKPRKDNARLLSMVLLFDKEQKLYVATSRRMMARDLTARVPGQRGVLGQALGQAEPVIGGPGGEDPELSYFAAFQDAYATLVIPLRSGFQNYGLLVFGSSEPDAFSQEHADLLAAIGTQATVALQNAVLYGDLRAEKERIIAVEEDARKKLARDLHDGPTQSVSAIAMRVNYIRQLFVRDPSGVPDELLKVEDLARKTTKDIRHMLFTLRPLVLENQGLIPALEQLGQKMKETHNLEVTVEAQPGVETLITSQAQGVLFYIVEEAVNNARKHAQAAHHIVRLARRENYMVVEIEDDGVGFDSGAVDSNYDQRGSLGMINMRERAALVEGTLLVDSAPGRGTKISVLIPLPVHPSGGNGRK